jgi:4-diphosphocytidyl-2-C-methyl-D-erythritol kinase
MKGRAFAKVNLSLRVKSARADGLHPVVSLAQSIDWADEMSLERAAEDSLVVRGAHLPGSADNLAWRGVEEIRAGATPPLRLALDKSIAVTAGLGGGSADAALALVLTTALLAGDPSAAVAAAPRIGADVPFCLAGGTAWMEGVGERLTPVPTPTDFWLAVVVPPFDLPTRAVFRRWDEMGGPVAGGVDGRALPVSLRDEGPLGNDLTEAAISLQPALGDWISDLREAWSQPVMMSGSGPALFGFFPTESEAVDAAGVAPDARATRPARPMTVGWEIEGDSVVPPAPWL